MFQVVEVELGPVREDAMKCNLFQNSELTEERPCLLDCSSVRVHVPNLAEGGSCSAMFFSFV